MRTPAVPFAAALAALALALLVTPAAAQAGAVPAKLAYVTGLAGTRPVVHVVRGDGGGAPLSLGPGADAQISPDGTSVAIVTPYTRSGSALVVRASDGSGAARTLLRTTGSLGPIVWSPDGARLAVVLDTRLCVVDVASGVRRAIGRGMIAGASFSPDGARIVYARARSQDLSAAVNLFVARVDGSDTHPLTHDGRSLWPLWGPTRIAYTHERLRRNDAPVYQLRTMRPDGSGVRQLTHMRIPTLVSGLSPTAWSADGRRLLAEFGGQDTSEAWTVDVRTGRARDLTGKVDSVIGRGLSPDGRTVLVQRGSFDDPQHQSVATVPWSGGRARVLVRRGGEPSWGGAAS